MKLKKIYNIIYKVFMLILGAILGYILITFLQRNGMLIFAKPKLNMAAKVLTSVLFAIILYSLSERVRNFLSLITSQIEQELSKKPLYEIVFASIGLILGLLIAFLLSQLILSFGLGIIGSVVSIIIYFIFVYLGVSIPLKNKETILNTFKESSFGNRNKKSESRTSAKSKVTKDKVLDTSAIIDGRIAEIIKTGFLDGTLKIPVYVLDELQHIADSADALKRNRGRRGLDIINEMKQMKDVNIEISYKTYENIPEVDSKLIKLAQDENLSIITNDFNLNKVAEVQGVQVLNINELANALKPIAIPGEKMIVQVVREGKEQNQGLAYLDDGTMIVIENGKDHIGETLTVVVTSILQTNAGKMIFVRPEKD